MTNQVQSGALKVMEERHSVRAYQPGHRLPEDHLEQLLNSTILAPSSWNLQHWKFLVIQDQAHKEKLLPIAFNQQQTVDSSAVIAVLGDLEANLNAEEVYAPLVAQGYLPQSAKDTLLSQINGAYSQPGSTIARDEAIRNASLASMQLMLAAKALGYDTCPMGGFDKEKFVTEFNVPSRYVPVMLITVGKAVKSAHASSRFPLEKVVVHNSF